MKLFYVITFFLFGSQLFIYSNSLQEKKLFSLGLVSSVDSIKTSVNLEVGFTIFSTEKFQMRSLTSISGSKIFDDEPNLYQLGLMEKITFGQSETSVIDQEKGFKISASRYGFFFTSFGFMAFDKNRESKFLFSSPYYWEIGGGAGLNLRLTQIVAFVAEVGGGLHIVNDGKEDFIKKLQKAGFGRMSLGFRYYIK